MESVIELLRVKIPEDQIAFSGIASEFFDIYDNSQNLTEAFLYAHQPISTDVIPIYSTSNDPIGFLDNGEISNNFNVINGPAIVVARKGYAGRLFVVEDKEFIVHEDAYPIKPKKSYENKIDLWYFVGHYSMSFQADRTSFYGIGDFPRERFKNQEVVIPKKGFQNKISKLYIERMKLIKEINMMKDSLIRQINDAINSLSN